MSFPAVQLQIKDAEVTMDNGILQVTLSKPAGIVTRIRYNGIDNLLEERNKEDNRGYWDLVWSELGFTETTGTYDRIEGTTFTIIVENEEQVELSFVRTWDPSLDGKLVALNIDKRFIMLRGSSGFYSYAIYERLQNWPGFNLPETRIAFKLSKDWFHFMAIADNRQRKMPLPDDRLPGRCEVLAYPEAVRLTHPIEEEFKGEVDDKYEYSCDDKDIKVQGWMCADPPTGFWQITPSNEFRSGGPLKQDLTSHVGPTNLAMFLSAHYAGMDIVTTFENGEAWKKVFGPIFMYVNCAPKDVDLQRLWEDAKEQMSLEVGKWPYIFPASEDFPSSDKRGRVQGRLLVQDRYISQDYIPCHEAYVGLAAPGEAGSWQLESKGYQFWTSADADGYFCIKDVREGDYNLYAWVPGFIGDYQYSTTISIAKGCSIYLDDLVYQPPRDGPTLWEIGIPDRTAAEFYVPDPDPMYINPLYLNHPDNLALDIPRIWSARRAYSEAISRTRFYICSSRFRQYGLWERYSELYPEEDLVYTVGVSDYSNDWFFAQVTRTTDKGYQGTTWQIRFKLDNVEESGSYKLRLALASANQAELQVSVNQPTSDPPFFTTGVMGKDYAIARHGIHGIYRLRSVDIPGSMLAPGDNTIYLTQSMCTSPFQGIMYDYIRLEGPSLPS